MYSEAARGVGQWIGEHGGQLVYGGGRNGLMGVVAESTQRAGGRVIGVIPKALVDLEHANTHCDELHVVDTMHERKALMADRSDAFIALPGGIGTFEELFEVWTWRQLRYHDKAIGILNVSGYYDALLAFLNQSVTAGFMSDAQMTLFKVGTDVNTLMRAVVQASGVQQVPDTLEGKL